MDRALVSLRGCTIPSQGFHLMRLTSASAARRTSCPSDSKRTSGWSTAFLLAGVFVAALLLLGIRVHAAGETRMVESDRAFHAGNTERALHHARAAARWYYPGSSHVSAAHARMRAIALGAEGSGDRALALLAWRSLRAATTETLHFIDTKANALRRDAARNVVRLLSASSTLDPSRQERLRTTYEQSAGRGGIRSTLVALGFIGMLLGLVSLVATWGAPLVRERELFQRVALIRLKQAGSLALLTAGGAVWLVASLMR